MRFQVSEFSYKEIERKGHQYMPLAKEWKRRFPKGSPIITIHILRNADLSPDKIDASFSTARKFFAKYFPAHDYEIFLCRTWLLYGPMRDILAADSNILAFSRKFQIIAKNQNTKQALDRIYGSHNIEKIASMNKESSLEKMAYKHLDTLGVAAGIIYK